MLLGAHVPLISFHRGQEYTFSRVTAPNLGFSDLFLPIRPFLPVSRPSSDTNHSSWLPKQMATAHVF